MKRKVIVRRADGKFLSYPSRGWVDEYPDALIFTSVYKADQYLTQNSKSYPDDSLLIEAIEHYGYISDLITPLNLRKLAQEKS